MNFPAPPSDIPPERMFNRFCRAMEHEMAFARRTAVSEEAQRTVASIWTALERAPVIYFDNLMYAEAMAAVKAADRMDLFLPPLMPFDEVVLVDSMGAVLLWDAVDFERGECSMEVADENTGETTMRDCLRRCRVVVFQGMSRPRPGIDDASWWALGMGNLDIMEPHPQTLKRAAGVRNLTMTICSDYESDEPDFRGTTATAPDDTGELFLRDFTNSVGTALDELYYVDLPRHHLIIEEPAQRRYRAGAPKLPRADDRPRVRLIDPEHIRRIRPSPEGGSGITREVKPHARRGHTKYLTSEHWKEKRWTRIRVRPSWVGEQEWRVGKYQYRVVIRPNDRRSL